MKKIATKCYWMIRVFVIAVVLIIIFSNLIEINNDELKKVIGAIFIFPAMWLDSLIFDSDGKNI